MKMLKPTGKKYIVNRTPRAGKGLGVPLIDQKQTNWCWAACADMVLAFRSNPGITQCQLANSALQLNGVQCCPSNAVCNRGLKDKRITWLWNHCGIPAYRSPGLNCNLLKYEIDNGRPVELGFAYSNNKGHVVIVHGWRQEASGLFFLINNSAGPKKQKILCTTLLALSQNGEWNATWRGL